MITSWLTGADRRIAELVPPWLLSLALLAMAGALVMIAVSGRPSARATALAWTLAP